MKLGLIGFGKMGQMVERLALEKGLEVSAIIDPKLLETISQESVSCCDVLIDFSQPHAVLDNVRKSASCGKNIVVGTTGWYDHLDDIKAIVKKYQIGLFYSPNFSLGVNLFMKIVERAASCLKDYDVAGIETHHKQKLDAPSGTALALTEIIKKNHLNVSDDFSFLSCRVGTNPGTHSIIFDSPEDTITLTHQAKTREAFAAGALRAASWIRGKKGVYTMNDLIT